MTLSGMDHTHFAFWGFLSQKQSARRRELEQIMELGMPCVVYESPNRVIKMLADICEVCGESTPVCVCRELTKLHEEILRTTAGEALRDFEGREAVKGEFAVVLYPQAEREEMPEEDILRELKARIDAGMTKKSAAAEVARMCGLPKNMVYRLTLGLGK